MDPRRLTTMLFALALLAGVGVTVALASGPTRSANGTPTVTTVPTGTTTCADEDQQGEDQQGDDEEADAATEVEHAAGAVEQEATRQQADDEQGDDQPGEQGDDQGENDDCGD
jgi:hypothetical protein